MGTDVRKVGVSHSYGDGGKAGHVGVSQAVRSAKAKVLARKEFGLFMDHRRRR